MTHHLTGVLRCRAFALFVLAALFVHADVVMAQAQVSPYEVTGFRTARFGMTEGEVRAIARESFGAKDDEMTVRANAVDGTSTLIVHVPLLEPGLGEGRVVYFFGYGSRRLIQVNVVWGEDTNQAPDDRRMIAAALRFRNHFLGYRWRVGSVQAGVAIDANAVLLFSGEDDKYAAVSLVLEGVRYRAVVNGVPTESAAPFSPTKLTISYIADGNDREIRRLTRRDF